MDVYDPRAVELFKLKLALAAFAKRLDEFEARVRSFPRKIGVKPNSPPPPDIDFAMKIVSVMRNRPWEY